MHELAFQPDRELSSSRPAPTVASVSLAFPEHRYGQAELLGALQRHWAKRHYNPERLDRLHLAVQVESRCLALPLEAYEELENFGAANDAFIRVGTDLAASSTRAALEQAGLSPNDVNAIYFTTVTGLATPTLDARLMNVLDLPHDVRRVPMFGLGCVGGAAGIARMADYLEGHPDHVAILVAVELCSLTLQEDDLSVTNLIATGLFGDGAATVVGVGARRRRANAGRASARVLASRSAFFPDTERVMGWDIGAGGFKVVLSAGVPDLIRAEIAREVDGFLEQQGLRRRDIRHWICHPGGPKVIQAVEEALELPADALETTRRSLAEVGNLSSVSVLHVLAQTLERARAGELGLMIAMGPGFCAEMVLLSC